MTFLTETIRLGLNNLRLHLLRSILTALGIILGVSAVILMSSISEGKMRQTLDRIEALGAKNIIVRSQPPPESNNMQAAQRRSFALKYGLTRQDLTNIQAVFDDADAVVPLKQVGAELSFRDRRLATAQAFGTTPELQRLANLRISRGRYLSPADVDERAMVAVIGPEIAKQLFPQDDPLGSIFRIDTQPFLVIGILTPTGLAGGAGTALVGRDLDLDVHVPITAAESAFGDVLVRRSSGNFQSTDVQISEIYLSSPERERVITDAGRLERLLAVRQSGLTDVAMQVPYRQLEDARQEQLTGRLITAAIASIALLVGGIGIMNIMLASVTERTREIGIRRALGATRKHIIWQFLVETSVLTCIGGLIGVALGIGGAFVLKWGVPLLPKLPWVGSMFSADVNLPTAVTPGSVFISFTVAALTGLVFGIYPARKAARQDPIEALRHD
jgi:putative ABC transport system permease protein